MLIYFTNCDEVRKSRESVQKNWGFTTLIHWARFSNLQKQFALCWPHPRSGTKGETGLCKWTQLSPHFTNSVNKHCCTFRLILIWFDFGIEGKKMRARSSLDCSLPRRATQSHLEFLLSAYRPFSLLCSAGFPWLYKGDRCSPGVICQTHSEGLSSIY